MNNNEVKDSSNLETLGSFKELIDQVRDKLGVTKVELSELLFVSTAAIVSWESGRRIPPVIHQEILLYLFENGENLKDVISHNRLKYLPRTLNRESGQKVLPAVTNRNFMDDFLRGDKSGVIELLMVLNQIEKNEGKRNNPYRKERRGKRKKDS